MSDRRRGAGIVRIAAALRGREDARSVFADGLLLGAMVGAAIAGSTLWTRWRGTGVHRSAAGLRSDRGNDNRTSVAAPIPEAQSPIVASDAPIDD